MKTIYPNADEKLVNGVILHAAAAKAALTYDEEGKEKVLTEDLKNLFIKGLVRIKLKGADLTYLIPGSYVEKNGVATVACPTVGASDAAAVTTFISTKA